jgi:aspartokinase-like uncharacterized kinase
MASSPVVVKVGGSLYDLPELGRRLCLWLDRLPDRHVLLVPGGGPTTNVVRDLDRRHGLGEEAAHWLALRALGLNAHFLNQLVPKSEVVEGVTACPVVWRRRKAAILDPHAFARADEGLPGCLPHRWSVTSDSLAARVAVVAGAWRLILLKSVTVPAGLDWAEAGRRGLVDECFAEVLRRGSAGGGPAPEVHAVNFRTWRP